MNLYQGGGRAMSRKYSANHSPSSPSFAAVSPPSSHVVLTASASKESLTPKLVCCATTQCYIPSTYFVPGQKEKIKLNVAHQPPREPRWRPPGDCHATSGKSSGWGLGSQDRQLPRWKNCDDDSSRHTARERLPSGTWTCWDLGAATLLLDAAELSSRCWRLEQCCINLGTS
ncbi:hypothetical protein GWK47_003714 [Chionoecetes opilio]|uniref:Uncharacterized protein n=1 Tax=Chionoecetes opilio TaxID=41210 RepID=A0A8J4YW66_CHIOP|nr:hypothetical protein GWK47_003714 [Chionoecetes opilio]